MVISSRFQTMTRKVDQVTITMYYLPDSAEGARKCLDVTEEAMRWYAKRIGPYPFPALAVVQVPNGSQQHSAQEHTGLFLIRSDILTPSTVGIYAAHELAHSWFFASVGNDQINQPWLDEGLATSVSLDFYRENYPQEYQAQWGVWGGSVEDFKNTIELNRGIFDFDNGSVYFWSIYRQGAAFFRVVREAMGDDAYWKALRAYTNDFAFKIAEPNDLLRALRAAAPDKDLVSIFRQFLDYPYLKYTNLNVTVGGSDASLWSGQVAVPISVTADSPTYTLSVILDGSVITTTNQPVTVTVDAGSLPDGSHTLAAIADDGGINRAEARRLFRVQQATATPMVTPVPTATRTPAPVAPRAAPSVTPQATITSAPTSPQTSPTPSPQPPPAAAGKTSLPALPVVSAVVVLVIGAGFLLARHKRWI
jgi:hypothetical protein